MEVFSIRIFQYVEEGRECVFTFWEMELVLDRWVLNISVKSL